jgi:hypothetical protein
MVVENLRSFRNNEPLAPLKLNSQEMDHLFLLMCSVISENFSNAAIEHLTFLNENSETSNKVMKATGVIDEWYGEQRDVSNN